MADADQPTPTPPPTPPAKRPRRPWLRTRIRQSRRYIGLVPARSLVQSFNFAFEHLGPDVCSRKVVPPAGESEQID